MWPLLIGWGQLYLGSYLEEDGGDDEGPDAVHHTAVVGEEGLAAAPDPDVELLGTMVVVIVGGVIGQVMLDAGPRGSGVTAAERDAVHQELPFHVTEDTTAGQRQLGLVFVESTERSKVKYTTRSGVWILVFFGGHVTFQQEKQTSQ